MVKDNNTMKILLVGQCHVHQIKKCMDLMAQCEIETVEINPLLRGEVTTEEWFTDLARKIEEADRVGVMTFCSDQVSDKIPASKLSLLPTVTTDALHPDATHVLHDGKNIGSLSRIEHSKLGLFSYCSGYSAEETLKLFNQDTYAELGYLDRWPTTIDYARQEEEKTGLPMVQLYESWRRGRRFMHNRFHPMLFVHADISRKLIDTFGLEMTYDAPETMIQDQHALNTVWPVYPEIARQYDIEGSYFFFVPSALRQEHSIDTIGVSLETFITDSFKRYERYGKEALSPNIDTWPEFASFEAIKAPTTKVQNDCLSKAKLPAAAKRPKNPYVNLAAHQHWRRAFTDRSPGKVDPVVTGKFRIAPSDRVATAGSCFAQHISKSLQRSGFNYYRAETLPHGSPKSDETARNFGVFSARYGNVYTTRQLLQLFERAFGDRPSGDHVWKRPDGRYADPYRPTIEPAGFETKAALLEDRSQHLRAVRTMFETLDVFVFTLGLTEAWRRKADGAILPVAPGVAAGSYDPEQYEFVNFSLADVLEDLRTFMAGLLMVNPKSRFILTVSPVPLAATYEQRHVLASTTYSKSVLRVVAEMAAEENPNCAYFPSYEIITGAYNRGAYFDKDLRSVTAAGVAHVMELFLRHYTNHPPSKRPQLAQEMAVVCDENLLLN